MDGLIKLHENFPERLLDCKVENLFDLLKGPSLFKLQGESTQPIFISTLLHGNEHSGFYAVQKLLRDWFSGQCCKKTIFLLLGNVEAGLANMRSLPGQPDFNRIWQHDHSQIGRSASDLLKYISQENPFACIDIHNNTGTNPFYACVSSLNPKHINLAKIFSQDVVYFTSPESTMTCSFAKFCPSVTLECGKSNDPTSILQAHRYLVDVFNLNHIPEHLAKKSHVYHTIARMRIHQNHSFSFTKNLSHDFTTDLSINEGIELLNFKALEENTPVGLYRKSGGVLVDAMADITVEGFVVEKGGILAIKSGLIPAMFTRDEKVIRQDCLGYLMERMSDQ